MKGLLSLEAMDLHDDRFLQFCVCPLKEVSVSSEAGQMH